MNNKKVKNLPQTYFMDLPLHNTIQNNLKKNKFTKMSPIQAYTIPELLDGKNVFGLARVGSGKTLSFVVPMLQHLISSQWSQANGLGALIIVPTRELGIQIFQIVNKIGLNLNLSCGMICGGHKYEEERLLLAQMNVLIATTGRIVQHLEQFHGNIGDQLQYLIFDEIDELLEQGFLPQIKQIIEYFPWPYLEKNNKQSRVTCFFSATESSKLESLIKQAFAQQKQQIINCKIDQEFVQYNNLHQKQEAAPTNSSSVYVNTAPPYKSTIIDQSNILNIIIKVNIYQNKNDKTIMNNDQLNNIVTQVHEADKIDLLFSFLRSFSQNKGIIFFATCKQVQFIYQVFIKLNPGVEIMMLNSKMSQNNRQMSFNKFKQTKHCYLLTTDVVARGIDITDVQFVIQLDCPQNVQQFIHRSGRCTRFTNKGNNILFLCQQEEYFSTLLEQQNIEFQSKFVKLKNTISIRNALQALVSQSNQLRVLAQKAVTSYAKSLYVQPNKQLFDYTKYNFTLFSKSYGLDVIVTAGHQIQQESSESDQKELLDVKQKNVNQVQNVLPSKDESIKKVVGSGEITSRIVNLQTKLLKTDKEDREMHYQMKKKMKYGDEESEQQEQINFPYRRENVEEFEEYEEEEQMEDVDWAQD